MSGWLVPVAVLVTSLALTYLFCVRPMRLGRYVDAPHGQAADLKQLDVDLVRARNELGRLRAELESQPAPEATSQSQR
jgi:hypothetical protein